MHVREQRDKLFLHEIHHSQEEGMFVSSQKMLLFLVNMRNRHTESLIQTNGGTLMWEDVTTDLY
jgi:hypothetical protein